MTLASVRSLREVFTERFRLLSERRGLYRKQRSDIRDDVARIRSAGEAFRKRRRLFSERSDVFSEKRVG